MFKLLILLGCLMTPLQSLSEVSKFQFETRLFKMKRHPYLPFKEDLYGNSALLWDLEWYDGLIFWRNELGGFGDKTQYRYTYWEYRWGLQYEGFEFGYYHKSEHILDSNKDDVGHPDKFPLEDSIFLRFNLLK